MRSKEEIKKKLTEIETAKQEKKWVATFENFDDFWDYVDNFNFEKIVSEIPEELTGRIVLTLEYIPDKENDG